MNVRFSREDYALMHNAIMSTPHQGKAMIQASTIAMRLAYLVENWDALTKPAKAEEAAAGAAANPRTVAQIEADLAAQEAKVAADRARAAEENLAAVTAGMVPTAAAAAE